MMKKVTYFDVEYANSKNKSICQIGLMCENYEDGEPVYPELDIYVNPDDGFNTFCTQIHGICAETVKNSLSFADVWNEIEKYFTNSIIIGHNVAGADLDALTKNLTRYDIVSPEFYYVDTHEIARKSIPSCYVDNYSMSTLCNYFDISIDNEHNAFDDACANADLLRMLTEHYNLDLDDYVKRYIPNECDDFIRYTANPIIRKAISEFYGVVTGIVIDEKVKQKEYDYIVDWKNENQKFASNPDINVILNVLSVVIIDGIISKAEMDLIKTTVRQFADKIECSQITLATQILTGIIKGIACDKEITCDECKNLQLWLYDHSYLRGHFPFDKIMETLDIVLDDNTITQEEQTLMLSQLDGLINPVEELKGKINDICGKKICLSGNFAYGQKSAVGKYIIERGGILVDTVRKDIDFLIVGSYECDSYSNGKYGTKVKKVIEYNQKGCNITILKETDFFHSIK